MSIFSLLKNAYIEFRVAMDPLYVLRSENLPLKVYLKALGVTHTYENAAKRFASESLREHMTGYFPTKVSTEIQCEIIKNHPSLVDQISFIDLNPCIYAAKTNPELLHRMAICPPLQVELYEYDNKLLDYIPTPSPGLQATAIKKEWTNVFRFENLSKEGLVSFLINTLGIGLDVETQNSTEEERYFLIQRKLEAQWDKVERGALSLLIEWQGIESDYENKELGILPQKDQRILKEKGIDEVSELLRDDIYQERYINSIIEFQQTTGLQIGEGIIDKMKSSDNKELFRIEGIKKAMSSTLHSPRTYNDIVHECVTNEVVRMETRLGSLPSSLPKTDTNISKSVHFNADKLNSIVDRFQMKGDVSVEACKELLVLLGLDPGVYNEDVHSELFMMAKEWQTIEKTGCVGGDEMLMDTNYIKNIGYSTYPEELANAVYKQSYKATIEDLRSSLPELTLPTICPVISGTGFQHEKLRQEGLVEGVEMTPPQSEGTIADIYYAAREEAINSVREKQPLKTQSGDIITPRLLTTQELISLRDSLRKLNMFSDVDDLTVKQLADLIEGKSVDVSNLGQVYRQKTIGGFVFKSDKNHISSRQNNYGLEL